MGHQQNDNLEIHTGRTLPLHTVLSQHYEILRHVRSDMEWITYLAKEIGTEHQIYITEFLPRQIAKRSTEGNHILPSDEKEFDAKKKSILQLTKTLLQHPIPHLHTPTSYFEEHNTLFLIYPFYESTSLAQSDIPITAGYLQSLAMTLCDTYDALHTCGYCYGKLSEHDVQLRTDGSFLLNCASHLQKCTDESDISQDIYMLCSFLNELFCLVNPEEHSDTKPEPYTVLTHVLQYRYHSAKELKNALIAAKGKLRKPKGAVTSGKSLFRTLLCIFCFLVAAAVPLMAVMQGLPLGTCMKLGLVHPDVISVWMPIPDTADEQEMLAMYRKLTKGFEKKYEGYGINLVIYADDSFSDALDMEKNGKELPTVFMNTRHEKVLSIASDLSSLTRSLPNSYLTDMAEFRTSIPLGFGLPAVYYFDHQNTENMEDSIDITNLSDSVCCDETVAELLDADAVSSLEPKAFPDYLKERSDKQYLGSTACLAVAENTSYASGALRVLPVSVDNQFPILYEMNCSVNEQMDWNSRCIGMLWLQYLLTEEAQQILFAENYSILPMHNKVLPQTVENHDALSFVTQFQSEFDTTLLQ